MSGTVRDAIYTIQYGNLSNAELDQIMEAVKYQRSVLARDVKRQLQRGDTVKFYSTRRGQTLQGAVEKVAIKYVTVVTSQGRWRVPANMLEVA